LESLGSGVSLTGFTMCCKWRWPGKTTAGTASGNEQQGDASGDGGMLRMRELYFFQKKVPQKWTFARNQTIYH